MSHKQKYDNMHKLSLDILRKEKKNVIICGDFNLLAFDKNKETNDFLNLMISN